MKRLTWFLLAGALALSGATAYFTQQFVQLNRLVESLRGENLDLTRRNQRLVRQQAKVRKQMAERRSALTGRNLRRAEKRLASAAASMVPFAGIAVITTSALLDIKDYCEEISEMEAFERELFGESGDEASPGEGDTVCDRDVLKQLQPITEAQLASANHWLRETYMELADEAERVLGRWRNAETEGDSAR